MDLNVCKLKTIKQHFENSRMDCRIQHTILQTYEIVPPKLVGVRRNGLSNRKPMF